MGRVVTQVFFRPDDIKREQTTLPAALYNRLRLLLAGADYKPVFVPIGRLQCLAVLDPVEIIFVDSLAYAVQDGQGGRIIMLAWQFRPKLRPDALNKPVPIDVVYCDPRAELIGPRLVGELTPALDRLASLSARAGPTTAKKVLPLTKKPPTP